MSMARITAPRSAKSGQSLVELSLGFAFFLFFLLGMLDIGRLYFIYVAMEDGAAEAALYYALNAQCETAADGPDCVDPNNALYRAEHASSQQVDFGWDDVVLDCDEIAASADNEDMVQCSITYPFKTLTPIITTIAGGSINLTAEAAHVRIAD
jgi:hypothetical protein